MRQLSVHEKIWPVAGAFTISRSSLSSIPTLWVEIEEDGKTGRAECRPYPRYNQTVESVIGEIEAMHGHIENNISKAELNTLMPPGPARNALDCALWDLEAKLTGMPTYKRLGLAPPKPKITAYTLSLNSPDEMATEALRAKKYPLLKIKVNQAIAIDATRRIIEARPDAKLIIDANEDLDETDLTEMIDSLPLAHIAMIEQPIAASHTLSKTLPALPVICADESLHAKRDINAEDLQKLWDVGYRAINVKLDKAGGLTAAFDLICLARSMNFQIMAGCMVGSSLAMAPMAILSGLVDILDLDGPLLLAEDCENGLVYEGALLHPPTPQLWG